MSDYTPSTEEVRGDYANFQLPAEGGDLRAEYAEALSEFDRWFASEIEKAERKTLKRAEEAAAQALTTWWLTDTLPEDDTDSVMDVRRAIRSLRVKDD